MSSRTFDMVQVDVFTTEPLQGNPLAVLPDARGLGDQEMQALARQMNLSETTFVLPAESAEADYRVRIFTPRQELPFAGHPTIGTAHALLETRAEEFGGRTLLRQQTLSGIQPIEISGSGPDRRYVTTLPSPRFSAAPAPEVFARALCVSKDDIVGEPLTASENNACPSAISTTGTVSFEKSGLNINSRPALKSAANIA